MGNSSEINQLQVIQHFGYWLEGFLQSSIPAFSSWYGIKIKRLSVYHQH